MCACPLRLSLEEVVACSESGERREGKRHGDGKVGNPTAVQTLQPSKVAAVESAAQDY